VAGAQIALRVLSDLGVDPAAVVMVDGSGLARKNLITPIALVDVLQGMTRSPFANAYRQSLAVAGVSGTLRNRFQDTPVAGRFAGKSGAISRNFALAGYLEPEAYPPLALAIFINNIDQRGSVARGMIDDIILQIAALERCGPAL
jgi:D-alanyl-D-alanine carboxypeptidase/D-alanyl-D-alanine-endopeptidase (penicillin-binding protein 4)